MTVNSFIDAKPISNYLKTIPSKINELKFFSTVSIRSTKILFVFNKFDETLREREMFYEF